MTDSQPQPDTDPSDKNLSPAGRRRRWPGPIVWGIVCLLAAGIVVAQRTTWVPDRALANILTLICGFNILVTFASWWLFFTRSGRKNRLRAVLGAAGVVALTASVVRPCHTTADLIPTFRFVWQQCREFTDRPDATGTAIDLATTTPLDFPQYLGPRRDMSLDGPKLARDWSARPPREVWRMEVGAGWSAFSAVNGYCVTLEQHEEQELVTCYELDSGKLVWESAANGRHKTFLGGVGPRSTPTIADGKVVALGATGLLRCLDGARGTELWSVDLLKQFGVPAGTDTAEVAWGRANSPLVVDSQVIVPAGGPAASPHSLAAFDLATGQLLWSVGDQQISYSSPIVATLAGVRQIVVVNESSVSGHRLENGEELWRVPWPGDSAAAANTSQPMPIDDDSLLVSKGYAQGAARIRLQAGPDGKLSAEFVWKSPKVLMTKLTSAVVYQGHAYGLNDGVLECVELEQGKRQWKLERFGHGQMLRVGELLLILSERGELVLVPATPELPRPVARLKGVLPGKTWNNLCLYGRFLVIRNAEQAACYELPLDE